MIQKRGLRNAVVLINSLPKKQASKIFMLLEPNELKVIFKHLNLMDIVSKQDLRTTYETFLERTAQYLSETNAKGSEESSSKVNPNQRKPAQAPWSDNFDFLIDVVPALQVKLLENEHPQNIALVLSLLPTDVGSGVVNEMPPETRVSVLRRMCQTEEFDKTRIKNLSQILQARLNKLLNKDLYKKQGVEVATRLLSCVDPKTYDSILSYLDHKDPDLASKLKESVFNFADLQHLNDRALKTILKSVDTSYWAPALKNSSLEMRQKIIRNLATKPAELLTFEISHMEPLSKNRCHEAQQQIVTICLQLADQGQITLNKTSNNGSSRASSTT
ncbi:MAG: hypothetical protein MK106_06785 [Mariniblastus sp.]|nr:hypothetical protein [Mariniblastus sp.]